MVGFNIYSVSGNVETKRLRKAVNYLLVQRQKKETSKGDNERARKLAEAIAHTLRRAD